MGTMTRKLTITFVGHEVYIPIPQKWYPNKVGATWMFPLKVIGSMAVKIINDIPGWVSWGFGSPLDDMTMDLGPLEWAKRIRMVRQVVPVVDFRVPTEQGNTAFDGSILMVGRSIFKCFTACKVDVRYPGSPAQKIRANFPEKNIPTQTKG